MAIPFYSEMQLNKNPLKGLVVESSNVAPSNPVAGQIYRNSSDNLMYWYNGSEWTTFGSGSGGGSPMFFAEYTYDAGTYNPMEVTITDFDTTLEDYYIFLYTNFWSPFTYSILINNTLEVNIGNKLSYIDDTSKYGTVILKYDSTNQVLNQICQTIYNYDTDTHNLVSGNYSGGTYVSGYTPSTYDLIVYNYDWEVTDLSHLDIPNGGCIMLTKPILSYISANEQAVYGRINISNNKITGEVDVGANIYIKGTAENFYDLSENTYYLIFHPVATRCICSDDYLEDDYDYMLLGFYKSNTNTILYASHPIFSMRNGKLSPWIEPSTYVSASTFSNTIAEMPTSIATWTIEGTTPSTALLNAFMTDNATNLTNWINNGTILKYTYTDSSDSVITYYFNVNFTKSGIEESYDFYCLNDNSKSFYIYDANGTYYWNTEPGACFIGTTIVHTENGMKYIKDINVGDKVLSFNFNTGREEYKEVNNIVAHKVGTVYRVELDDDILQCTYDEPFIMKDKNKVQAQFLHMYDKLYSTSRKEQIIQRVTTKIDQSEMVYDLSVKDNYNYLVGKNKIVVATENITKI